MLSNRTQIVLSYVRGVSDGTMKADPEILRMISGLMAGLPVEEAQEFREEFLTVGPGRVVSRPLRREDDEDR